MCKKKNFVGCDMQVIEYKYGRMGHYSRDCTLENKKWYECGGSRHISKDFPQKNEEARPNAPRKPKERAFQMILNGVDDIAGNQEYGDAYLKYKISRRRLIQILLCDFV